MIRYRKSLARRRERWCLTCNCAFVRTGLRRILLPRRLCALQHNRQVLRMFPTMTGSLLLDVHDQRTPESVKGNTMKEFIEAHLTAACAQSPCSPLLASHSKIFVRSDASVLIGLDQPAAVSNHPGRPFNAFDIEPRSGIDRATKTFVKPSLNGRTLRPHRESLEIKHDTIRVSCWITQTAAHHHQKQPLSSRSVRASVAQGSIARHVRLNYAPAGAVRYETYPLRAP